MPEMTFTVEWPDGARVDCYSPSLVVHDHLRVGETYPVADFVGRTSRALDEAGERVRQRYGFLCTSAIEQREQIQTLAARYAHDGVVTVLAMHPPLPESQPLPADIGEAAAP